MFHSWIIYGELYAFLFNTNSHIINHELFRNFISPLLGFSARKSRLQKSKCHEKSDKSDKRLVNVMPLTW